jgi:hypothetical protein
MTVSTNRTDPKGVNCLSSMLNSLAAAALLGIPTTTLARKGPKSPAVEVRPRRWRTQLHSPTTPKGIRIRSAGELVELANQDRVRLGCDLALRVG